MNRDASDSSGKSEIEVVVDQVCRDFERKFRDNASYRIENLLDEFPGHVAVFDSDSKKSAAQHQSIAELIFVEMDMRYAVGQSFTAREYLDRFPDFAPSIHESLNRLRLLHPRFRENCSIVTVIGAVLVFDDDLTDQVQLDQLREASVPSELGPYREITEINSGGFGIVCRAVDSRDGRVVALKFPRKEKLKDDPDLKMFLAEASKAMRLEHPGIVRTHSIERSDGYLAIVQQFVDGSDLKATRQKPRSQQEISRLVARIAESLAYAHQQGIYHRDLKPGNILVDQNDHPYVADFGLALNESEQIYLPKQRCGTPHYMPPEQVAGLTRLLDGRSDIWSLGVILYELLTKRRPFEGLNIPDVFEQIENKDPKPPRQSDPSIDPELQRICLKCLERQQRDRYLTADVLADDLNHWAGQPTVKTPPVFAPSPMVPKGLRSYSAEDAAFFLDLLPGPRDRNGLPGNIRFWKTRIAEPVAPENRVPVGVIFGPSGSGKSSFVKAGLLPQLASDVLTVYVEATQADTEVRLIKALRQRRVEIPDEITLPEVFRGLSLGHWLPPGFSKLLIVIDQFEQRLSQPGDYESSQLARSLRFCDGEHLQCLLLTRDDFMMALSRFSDALEMDLREGENAQAIDLFDRKHARKVLARLGRAYDRLPADPTPLTEEQELFLDEAVDQLADDDHVICVRLALFAEMFRYRDWTPAELKLVGGVAGTGERFLEATFGPTSRDKRHRMQREPAQRVLETLLPVAGMDIRGAMKPEQELVAAARLQNQPGQFDDLIETLDGQLRLITRTDPDRPQEAEEHPSAGSGSNGWYQLTHDYLVPSIRRWLDSSLGLTRAGRARLRLRDLAAQMVPGQQPRNLPTNLEWLSWRYQIPTTSLGENEKSLMRTARNRLRRQTGLTVAFLLLLGTLAGIYLYQDANKQRVDKVDGLIDKLIQPGFSATPQIVAELLEYRTLAEPLLRAKFDNPQTFPDERTRVSMGLLPFDSHVTPVLIDAITRPDCPPEELDSISKVLMQFDFSEISMLSHVLTDASSDPRSQFRSVCAESILKAGKGDWSSYAGLMANVLWDEPITSVDAWIKLLAPIGDQLVSGFAGLFESTNDPAKAMVLAQSLYAFYTPTGRLGQLAKYIPTANASQFNGILSTIEENADAEPFSVLLTELLAKPIDKVGQVNVSLALLRLGTDDSIVGLYSSLADPFTRILSINFSTSDRIRLYSLVSLYKDCDIGASADVHLRRAVLQALALQSHDAHSPDLRTWLLSTAIDRILCDPDACCFSTSELIIRRLGFSEEIPNLRTARRLEAPEGLGNVFIDERGIAFSILDMPESELGRKRIMISINEVTYGEMRQFFQEAGLDQYAAKESGLPFEMNSNGLVVPYSFCNWLGICRGLSPDDLCYAELVTIEEIINEPAKPDRFGFRLPKVEEWDLACESNRDLEKAHSINNTIFANTIFAHYAWTRENSPGDVRNVGLLLPNDAGLFDSFGNVQEICQTTDQPPVSFVEKGQNIRSDRNTLSVERVYDHFVPMPVITRCGFRIVTAQY